ncbi:MAG: hypothetical protein KUG68_00560 [Flavobacteriaceae bacterium]|nr:hypothetical protein [Flavobacteriaceae bacterium]
MKKQLLKISFFALLLVGMVSCSSDDSNENDNNPAPEGQFIATIDANAFVASSNFAAASFVNGIFNVSALNTSTNETIVITISEGSVGTFDLSDASNLTAGAVYTLNGGNSYGSVAEGGSGQLIITKIDEENGLASGTFQFVGTRQIDDNGNIVDESVTVTNGAFNNIPLATDVGGNSNNTLTAKVDGIAPNFDSVNAIYSDLLGPMVTVSAISNATSQNIGFSIPEDTELGTFELTSYGDFRGLYAPVLGGEKIYGPTSGSITITSLDTTAKTITGTFEFTAEDLDILNSDGNVFEITEGVFSVEY